MSSHPLDHDSPTRVLPALARGQALAAGLPDARIGQRLVVIFGLWVAVALLYWPSSRALAGFWSDAVDRAYTHGYLVLLISIGLVVRERATLAAATLRADPRALLAVLVFSAAWAWFYLAAVQDLHLLLLPLLLLAALYTVLGAQVTRTLLFPIAFLYFAMPVWSDLVGVLQALSIRANSALIWLTGLPAYVTGDLVHVPAGTLEIAGGCSGLHSFVVGLALAALYGELARDPLRWRLAWMGLMAALAMIGNWVRIFVIIAAAEATDMRTFLVTVDHYWFGWGVFLVCFLCFLWLAGRLRGPNPNPAVSATPQRGPEKPAGSSLGTMVRAGIGALVGLAVLPAAVYATEPLRAATRPIEIVWSTAPVGWQGPAAVGDERWKPQFDNASMVARRLYAERDGLPIEVFIAAYARQQQGAKLLSYGNSLLGAEGELLDEHIVQTPAGPWDQTTVQGGGGARSLIWSRYEIGGHAFVRPRWGQLWYGVATLAGPLLSSVTALRTLCQPQCDAAHERLLSVAAQLQPTAQFESVRR